MSCMNIVQEILMIEKKVDNNVSALLQRPSSVTTSKGIAGAETLKLVARCPTKFLLC